MKKKSELITGTICLLILFSLFGAVSLRAFTREILVRKLNIVNPLVRMAWFNVPESVLHKSTISWDTLYPFPPENSKEQKSFLKNIQKKMNDITAFFDGGKATEKPYIGDRIIGYSHFANLCSNYERLFQWEELSRTNSVTKKIQKMDDGQLYITSSRSDMQQNAVLLNSFNEFCEQQNIPFLYIQAPYKISPDDTDIAGKIDFSNQKIDNLMKKLHDMGVPAYDIREDILAEHLNFHELFFRTDHHWTPETGLWASKHILEKLNEQFNYGLDVSLLDENKFSKEIYPGYYLGSYGREVTILNTEPDDISLLYPDYPTRYRYQIPSSNIDIDGDFSILYAREMVDRIDYYNLHPYSAYLYGNKPLETVTNLDADNDLHILILRDSYGAVTVPFLSLAVNRIDTIDLRYFTGSLHAYIEQEQPDLIIVLYSTVCFESTQLSDSHTALFDFR